MRGWLSDGDDFQLRRGLLSLSITLYRSIQYCTPRGRPPLFSFCLHLLDFLFPVHFTERSWPPLLVHHNAQALAFTYPPSPRDFLSHSRRARL